MNEASINPARPLVSIRARITHDTYIDGQPARKGDIVHVSVSNFGLLLEGGRAVQLPPEEVVPGRPLGRPAAARAAADSPCAG